ncbi:hypothetical protein DID78_07215 [Candidatus Marinamargulisbacteria bacterium SCGC AG-343-D04]|nr:hypothetical protein DID78_07215 [Candidatus Marinamargulisbacteria bacterium SCGC AG-343-D04]
MELDQIGYFVPFYSFQKLYGVALIQLTNQDKKKVQEYLSLISYYFSVVLDRIFYIEELSKKNQELVTINNELDKMNKHLELQLSHEVKQVKEALELAESLELKHNETCVYKELSHEINNVLSIAQLDLHSLGAVCNQKGIDWNYVESLESENALTKGEVQREFKEKGIERKIYQNDISRSDLEYLSRYQQCQSIYHYLSHGVMKGMLKTVEKTVSKRIKDISDIVDVTLLTKKVLGKKAVVENFDALIQDLLTMFRGAFLKENIKVTYTNKCPTASIEMQYIRCNQVFINIIKNSIEAMRGLGNKQLSIYIYQRGKKMYVEIQDTGRGMAGINIKEAIKSTKKGHLGVGLTLVKELLNEVGGVLKIVKKEEKVFQRICFSIKEGCLSRH